jgi:nitrogen fixation NifU-like protein
LADELKTYSKAVIDHFQNPRNLGDLQDATHTVMAENPLCQDIVKLSVKVRGDTVEAVRIKIMGCTVAIASASMMGELMRGKPLGEVKKLDQKALVEALGGLPEHKVRCMGAPLKALAALLDQLT